MYLSLFTFLLSFGCAIDFCKQQADRQGDHQGRPRGINRTKRLGYGVGGGAGWLWGVGPCGRPLWLLEVLVRGLLPSTGGHKGPHPTPLHPRPYALAKPIFSFLLLLG